MCLTGETCETVGVEREEVGEDFQRDVTRQLPIARAIDLAHAPGAERGEDFIRAESTAGGQ